MIYNKEKLDGTVLDIEFLIISVVQGIALTSLAISASEPVGKLSLEYFPYIVSGFLFILIFWSQAILHAISFIDWPLDIEHNFIYFLASFVEVMLFNQITNPFKWFIFSFVFFLVAGILYIFDFKMIQKRKDSFLKHEHAANVYNHIYKQQRYELFILLPIGLLFNIGSALVIYLWPSIFLQFHFHIMIGLLQTIFTLGLLTNSIRSFRERSKLITRTYTN